MARVIAKQRALFLAILLGLAFLGATAAPAAAMKAATSTTTPLTGTPTTCSVVSIKELNATLGIDAAHVTSVHPASPIGALICSYYGNSGRSANEATVNYVPATAKAFSVVEASLASSHKIRSISRIKSGAYSYVVGSERYLYVYDGATQVQMFATTPLAKLEALARELTVFT